LANGPLTVPYSVQWSQTSGQSTGTALTAGTALTGLATTAANPTCSTSPSTTSSLVVTISAPSLQSMVSATTYTGSLTLLVTPQ
jgi:tetrahydromethanopterin S-methyltransferase subunit D